MAACLKDLMIIKNRLKNNFHCSYFALWPNAEVEELWVALITEMVSRRRSK